MYANIITATSIVQQTLTMMRSLQLVYYAVPNKMALKRTKSALSYEGFLSIPQFSPDLEMQVRSDIIIYKSDTSFWRV